MATNKTVTSNRANVDNQIRDCERMHDNQNHHVARIVDRAVLMRESGTRCSGMDQIGSLFLPASTIRSIYYQISVKFRKVGGERSYELIH